MIFSLIGAIVGEFVGATAGLGMLIQSMNFTMDVAGQFSILLILSILGLALNGGVNLIRRPRIVLGFVTEKPSRRRCGQGRYLVKRLAIAVLAAAALASPAQALDTIKVGWCARTLSSAGAPFAIATKNGLVRESRVQGRGHSAPRLHRLREGGRDPRCGILASLGRAIGDHSAAGREGEKFLYRLSGQHLRNSRARRRPHPEIQRSQGQDHWGDFDGLGRRHHRARDGED